MQEMLIDLIRHGEPIGGQRLRGAQDDPLSELGWTQMHAAVGEDRPWAQIVSSPLSRCKEFASQLAGEMGLDLRIEPDLREISFGAWEGMTTKELMQKEPDALKNYWLDPDRYTPPDGEPLSQFTERVSRAWEQLLEQQKAGHTLVVCHGGVIRAVLAHVLGMDRNKLWNIDVPYANISRVAVQSFGDTSRVSQLKFHQARLI